jgi:hypothetical protein
MKQLIFIVLICTSFYIKAQTQQNANIKLYGKITDVYYSEPPCSYVYLKVLTSTGKKLDVYIDEPDKLKLDNQNFFKWSSEKIYTSHENLAEAEVKVIKDAYNTNFINKTYTLYCYKDLLQCGDDPSNPKDYFCNKISVK